MRVFSYTDIQGVRCFALPPTVRQPEGKPDMSRRNRLAACSLALSLAAPLGLVRPAAAQYTLTPLPANFSTLRYGQYFNNNGQILGYISNTEYLFTNGVL